MVLGQHGGSGRVPVGVDASQDEFKTVELIGGEKTHSLTMDEMPRHWGHVNTWDGNFIYMFLDKDKASNVFTQASDGGGRGWTVQAGNEVVPSTYELGYGLAHQNLQPYITCYMWKRTA